MRLAAEVPAEAPAEAPTQSPAPGGRKDGMASSTTRKFKSLQAALAEPRLIGGWRLARKMMIATLARAWVQGEMTAEISEVRERRLARQKLSAAAGEEKLS